MHFKENVKKKKRHLNAMKLWVILILPSPLLGDTASFAMCFMYINVLDQVNANKLSIQEYLKSNKIRLLKTRKNY
jgi:hypothetical protein